MTDNLVVTSSAAPTAQDPDGASVPPPAWIVPTLVVKEGRDPLGLQTTTQDRLMPFLLPGLLELSRRARYFSLHAFLLDEYRKRRLPVDRGSLSAFIKRREWDFGLAVQRCPQRCGSSPVGSRRLGAAAQGPGPFPRGESVESELGGYGLYYRTPMIEFGLVAPAGTMLGDRPIPIDVLRDTERAARLAGTFRAAVEGTEYFRRAMWTTELLPAEVVDEYAAVACLCGLGERAAERDAVHEALFGSDDPEQDTHLVEPVDLKAAPVSDEMTSATDDESRQSTQVPTGPRIGQRRRSVAHYLTLLEHDPRVAANEGAYRDAIWSPPDPRSDMHAAVAGQWASLVAKDVWQEALCSVWSHFCRAGLERQRGLGLGATRDLEGGLSWDEVREVAIAMVAGPPTFDLTAPTAELVDGLASGSLALASDSQEAPIAVANASLEHLAALTRGIDTATSGLVVLLELARRARTRSGPGWEAASRVGSGWQPSLATVLGALEAHLDRGPTVGGTLWWLVSTFVVPVHERIAYSKLPEFTFRFRWDDGRLRFYDHGVGRFPLAAIRRLTLASMTRDLGLWEGTDNDARLTNRGTAFVTEVLG